VNIAPLLRPIAAGLVLALAAAVGAQPSFAAEAAASTPAMSAPGASRAGSITGAPRADCAASAPPRVTSKARHVPDEADPCATSTGAVPAGKR
jgi:hypothetical protein